MYLKSKLMKGIKENCMPNEETPPITGLQNHSASVKIRKLPVTAPPHHGAHQPMSCSEAPTTIPHLPSSGWLVASLLLTLICLFSSFSFGTFLLLPPQLSFHLVSVSPSFFLSGASLSFQGKFQPF